MALSKLEQIRLLHQEIEQQIRRIGEELLEDPKNVKERIIQEERVAKRIRRVNENARKLLESYEDADGSRAEELKNISGENVFTSFYDRLKDTRDYHRKAPPELIKMNPEYEVKIRVKFSGEETQGQYVDLHDFHDRYLNLRSRSGLLFDRCDYISFLGKIGKLREEAKAKKEERLRCTEYAQWAQELLDYLVSFVQRTNPLADAQQILRTLDADFAERWEKKQVPGWQTAVAGANGKAAEDGKTGSSSGEANGMDTSDPLFCKACQKQFAKQTVFDAHLNGKKHKKAVADAANAETLAEKQAKQAEQERSLARLEDLVAQFALLLKPVLDATRSYLEKKQTRTFAELQAESELAEQQYEEEEEEDEDDDKPIYNPLNLPLGWDGKPIPYWLYKLHGLNIEYKCEICGGYSYWGPRAFEQHFRQWRHAYGMRCLGIKYTDEFLNITKIEDAVALDKKLQGLRNQGVWRPEEEEEFEDRDGNVYNKKTYDDLVRQGLI